MEETSSKSWRISAWNGWTSDLSFRAVDRDNHNPADTRNAVVLSEISSISFLSPPMHDPCTLIHTPNILTPDQSGNRKESASGRVPICGPPSCRPSAGRIRGAGHWRSRGAESDVSMRMGPRASQWGRAGCGCPAHWRDGKGDHGPEDRGWPEHRGRGHLLGIAGVPGPGHEMPGRKSRPERGPPGRDKGWGRGMPAPGLFGFRKRPGRAFWTCRRRYCRRGRLPP